MSFSIIIAVVIALAIAEYFWAPYALRALRLRSSTDKIMAEPGETITLIATVENHARLPIPFVRVHERLPFEAQIQGDPQWIKTHCQQGIRKWYVEEKLSLKSRQRSQCHIQFSLPARGVYSVGDYVIGAGDLLGFREAVKNGTGKPMVIIPARSGNHKSLQALGGFLGDVSVRRFILEDPILTVGFRDYTGHEPMKSISWTRTAAAGTLQVKQFDHTAEQNITVLLNTEGGSGEALEECFRLMRTVSETLEQKKIPYAMRTNGNLPGPVGKIFSLASGLGSRHKNTLLYALGRADHTCYRSFRYLVTQTLRNRKSNESYIVITPKLDAETQALIHQLDQAVGNPVCVLSGEEAMQ
jgi:uncharacterized protein (DUF58 family)